MIIQKVLFEKWPIDFFKLFKISILTYSNHSIISWRFFMLILKFTLDYNWSPLNQNISLILCLLMTSSVFKLDNVNCFGIFEADIHLGMQVVIRSKFYHDIILHIMAAWYYAIFYHDSILVINKKCNMNWPWSSSRHCSMV